MENHPIPQDVTGFKFRLIGSVTVKQFLYILGAGALCGVFFIMPIPFIVKWPIIVIIAGVGAGLAFLPIEGRPMDVMLMNFLKALPAENRYIFHKKGADALLHDYFTPQLAKRVEVQQASNPKEDRRELLLSQLVHKSAPYKVDEEEKKQMQNISGMFESSDAPVTGMTGLGDDNDRIAAPINTPVPIQADSYVAPEASPAIPTATDPVLSPSSQQPEPTPPQPGVPAVSIAPENQITTGFPQIPDTPNIVLGIVKDARGKVLPNIIVEVVDSSGSPVRAFKTNALGQFASATPLPKGKYQILLEDTRRNHEFAPIDIEMKNEIFQPLEIISTDQREKLRQELFGTQTAQQ